MTFESVSVVPPVICNLKIRVPAEALEPISILPIKFGAFPKGALYGADKLKL